MKNETIARKIFVVVNTAFMLFMIVICLYPMIYVLFASLSDSNLLMAHRGLLMSPIKTNIESYKAVLQNDMIGSGYMNTIFIVTVGVLINLLMTSLGAYFLSRRDVMLKNIIMGFITFTMFFGGGLIPFYLTVKSIGLYNSLWALILPTAISTFNMIIMRTSFMTIPASLEESAKIDGAGHITILARIILPLSKAIIAVMVLFYGVGHWNSWFNAMLFLNKRELFPLQLVLREILLQNDTQSMMQGTSVADGLSISETVKYAVIIVATLPILTVYPFLQRYFVQGVMVGALKG